MKTFLLFCGTLMAVALVGFSTWDPVRSLQRTFGSLRPTLLPNVEAVSFSDTSHARHIAASSRATLAVRQWVADHQDGWKHSSTLFSWRDTQILSDTYCIALTDHKILLAYKERSNDDEDDEVHLERVLSPEDQLGWADIIAKILAYNSVLEPPPASSTALQRTASSPAMGTAPSLPPLNLGH